MKLDVTSLSMEPQWHEYRTAKFDTLGEQLRDESGEPVWETCRLSIRPYPTSEQSIIYLRDGKFEFTGAEAKSKFLYCLVDWQGIEDGASGKAIPCTPAMKELIFESPKAARLRNFVMGIVAAWDANYEAESKNL